MSKDFDTCFEHTLKSGKPMTVYCADWQSYEPDTGAGGGYESVWAENDGQVLELTPAEEQEIFDATGELGYPDDED